MATPDGPYLSLTVTDEPTELYEYHTFDRWLVIDLTDERVYREGLLKLLRDNHRGWTKAYMVYGDVRGYDEDGFFIRLLVPDNADLVLVEIALVQLFNDSGLFRHDWQVNYDRIFARPDIRAMYVVRGA